MSSIVVIKIELPKSSSFCGSKHISITIRLQLCGTAVEQIHFPLLWFGDMFKKSPLQHSHSGYLGLLLKYLHLYFTLDESVFSSAPHVHGSICTLFYLNCSRKAMMRITLHHVRVDVHSMASVLFCLPITRGISRRNPLCAALLTCLGSITYMLLLLGSYYCHPVQSSLVKKPDF